MRVHPVDAVVVVPSTPAIIEALGDPAVWERRYPCKCADCLSRGIAMLEVFRGVETSYLYGQDQLYDD